MKVERRATNSTYFLDISWSQQCVLVPTHIFRRRQHKDCRENRRNNLLILNQDMGALDEGKKRHPISKIPLSGPSCEEFPLFSSSCALPTSPLSSSLLFFFNQAVWGCQVFWDEDSQPCEKLIPCGPSSPWRSSPWEHWWWLVGRWWWGVKRKRDGLSDEGWDEHRATLRIEWHRLSQILHH